MAQQYDNTNTCAVWKAKTKTGETYVKVMGTTEGGEAFSFNCFANNFKTEDKHPDFKSSKPKDQQAQSSIPKRVADAGNLPDDIPF